MERLEVEEGRSREAKIAVEEVPSTDAMGNCLRKQSVFQCMSFSTFTVGHVFNWFLLIP